MKLKKIWNLITFYGVLQYLLFAIALAASNNYIIDIICISADISERSKTYPAICTLVSLSLAGIWIYLFFCHIRDKR